MNALSKWVPTKTVFSEVLLIVFLAASDHYKISHNIVWSAYMSEIFERLPISNWITQKQHINLFSVLLENVQVYQIRTRTIFSIWTFYHSHSERNHCTVDHNIDYKFVVMTWQWFLWFHFCHARHCTAFSNSRVSNHQAFHISETLGIVYGECTWLGCLQEFDMAWCKQRMFFCFQLRHASGG